MLALGKHGARELNYSSDIDLIVLFDRGRGLDSRQASSRARCSCASTKALARLLQERTRDGYVLRVDLRLRPDPAATPVALSTASACAYYETLGQNWERAAMIKARPAAGDLEARPSASSPNSRRSSGANISTTPRSPTFTR